MAKIITSELSPNTQKDDFDLALYLLLHPKQYLVGESAQLTEKWFRNYFNVPYAISFESARTGMYFVLKTLGVHEGDEVLIQAFTCVAASNPIKWLGAHPVFVDINPRTCTFDIDELANKITNKTRAIIVQYTFGYPAEIDKIQEIARSKGIPILEDCTHTIGTEFKGKKLGTFGDTAVFSFGRDKAISGSFGGMVVTNREDIGKKLGIIRDALSYPSKIWVARQLLYTIVSYLTRKYQQTLSIGKLIHFIFSKLKIILLPTTAGENQYGQMPSHAKKLLPNAFAHVAYHQLEKLEKLNKLRHQLHRIYVQELEKRNLLEVHLPDWPVEEGFYPLRIPLLVERKAELKLFAEKNGIVLGNWYDVPVAPKQVNLHEIGYVQGSCPQAEKVCEQIVNLPITNEMDEKDARRGVQVLESFYRNIKVG